MNQLTGAGSASIPIYTLSSGQVSVPISIVYSGTGIKPKDVEGTAGMGWQLLAGGQISRQVRGLPDDIVQDNAGNIMYGWMSISNNVPSYVNSFSIANDGDNTTCTDEASDISYLGTYFPYTNDSEPDMFYVNAPGLSCQMVYDKTSAQFKPVSYQDLKISYGMSSNNIYSFSITNDKGITYLFSNNSFVTQVTTGGSQLYFTTKYKQYQHGITYVGTWNLTSITDASGNAVVFSYSLAPARSGTDKVSLYISGSTSSQLQYNIVNTSTPETLSSIYTTNVNNPSQRTSVSFTWFTTGSGGSYTSATGQTIITSINIPGHDYELAYTPVQYSSSYYRYFLRGLTDAGCSSPVNYQFTYAGETATTSGFSTNYSTALPDSSSYQIDYWGYYAANSNTSLMPEVMMVPAVNTYPRDVIYQPSAYTAGSYSYVSNGYSRVADPSNVMTGSLNKITYAEGGSTSIVYESNDYLDVPSGLTVQGGGIRVKQIIDNDNITGTSITRNYTYTNPSSSLSSGKPISLPVFAFILPYNGPNTGQSLWTTASALSDNDLSDEDHTIMYEYCKMNLSGGGGSTLYQYYVPATNWDAYASPACSGCGTEWYPTINYSARESCTTVSWMVSNSTHSYPFIPSVNYDFERGLPLKVKAYDNSNNLVSETDYTYSRTASPSVITAVRVDDDVAGSYAVKSYGKYPIYYNTAELTTSVAKTVYDAQGTNQAQTSTINNTYGGASYKLSSQQVTNSDGSLNTAYFKYTKDLTTAIPSSTNANLNALYYLQQQNINTLVESYQQVTRNSTTYTTAASLTLFNAFTFGSLTDYLPAQQLKFIQPDGVTNFSPFSINASAQTIAYDSRYYPVVNFDIYDDTGTPRTVDDAHQRFKTIITEHNYDNPVAIFNNAAYAEIGFNDFDSNFTYQTPEFSITGTGSASTSGHTGGGYNLGTSQSLTKIITKNPIAQNYVFSAWVNSSSGGTIYVALNNGSSTYNYSKAFSGSSAWQYVELKVPLTYMTGSFTATMTASAAITIDDVLFYPDVAQVSTTAYDATTHFKNAETNTNGISTYYTYDQWGRLLYQFDQDKNIVLKKTYVTPQNVQDFATPVISSPGSGITTATAVTLSTNISTDACSNIGLTYVWNFGDGSPTVSTTSATAPAHTYTSAGTYTVNLTVNSLLFPSKTASPVSVTVTAATASVTMGNYSSTAGVYSVTLTNSSNTYTFNYGNLTGNILPGTYTVTITPYGGNYNSSTGHGFNSIVFADGSSGYCYGYGTSNHVFSWTVAAGDSLTFYGYNNYYCPFD